MKIIFLSLSLLITQTVFSSSVFAKETCAISYKIGFLHHLAYMKADHGTFAEPERVLTETEQDCFYEAIRRVYAKDTNGPLHAIEGGTVLYYADWTFNDGLFSDSKGMVTGYTAKYAPVGMPLVLPPIYGAEGFLYSVH